MRRVLFALCALLALSRPASAAEPLTLLLDWYVNPNHGPFFVAQERGLFAKRDLTVTLIAPADPNDPPKLVAAGKGDVAVSYQTQLHIAADQGAPLLRIGTLVGSPLNSVVSLRDGPIKSLADLKGRKVGYSVAGFEDVLLQTMLETAGLGLKDVELINLNFNLTPALLTGQVDAVIGAYRNVELVMLAQEGKPGRLFPVEEYGVPAYDELILVAKADRRADPKLKRFVAAVEEAAIWLANHPAEGWDLFIKGRPELNDPKIRQTWDATMPYLDRRTAALSRGRYETVAAFMKARGMVKTTPPLDGYAVELP